MAFEMPEGAILFCKLGPFEHTGIYIGNGKIVELSGEGRVQVTNAVGFVSGFPGTKTIYVASDGFSPLASKAIARRAKHKVGHGRNYNLILDNCHQFTAGCITGDYENNANFFGSLEYVITHRMNKGRQIEWRVCSELSAEIACSDPEYFSDKLEDGSRWLPIADIDLYVEDEVAPDEAFGILDERKAARNGWVVLRPPRDYGFVELELSWWFIKWGQVVGKGEHILDLRLGDLIVPYYSPVDGTVKETSMLGAFSPEDALAFIDPKD